MAQPQPLEHHVTDCAEGANRITTDWTYTVGSPMLRVSEAGPQTRLHDLDYAAVQALLGYLHQVLRRMPAWASDAPDIASRDTPAPQESRLLGGGLQRLSAPAASDSPASDAAS